jgi:hypothetical protein
MPEIKEAFDQWLEWANKPLDSELSIPSDLHGAVSPLAPDDRLNRDKVKPSAKPATRKQNTDGITRTVTGWKSFVPKVRAKLG